MTRRLHLNNFITTLASNISASATSIVITSATGLPTLGSGETYRLTLTAAGGATEIVTVTARSGTTLTVTRGQESTTAQVFLAGAGVELRETADSYDRKADMVSTAGDVLNFGDATSLEIPNSTAPTLSATGQMALDTSVTDYADGLPLIRQGSTDYALISIPLSGMASPTNNYVVTYDSTADQFKLAAGGGGGGGSGDVVGPASATDNAIARFDTTTGKLIQNSAGILDDNGNLSTNNMSPAYATTATAAGTTVLTVASTQQQFFTGSTTQTVTLPVVSTLALGFQFRVVNNSSGVVTVESSGANSVQAMAASSSAIYTVISTSGTTAASWSVAYFAPAGGGSGDVVGPASSTDLYAAIYDGTTGKLLKNGGRAIIDTIEISRGGKTGGTTTNTNNTGVGVNTLAAVSNATGTDNTAVGYQAGDAISTGNKTTAIGANAGGAISTNGLLTAVGANAGVAITGANNTVVGADAATSITTGSQNTIMGTLAGQASTALTNCTFIGYQAGKVATGNTNVAIGTSAAVAATSFSANTIVGSLAAGGVLTGANNVFMGYLSATAATGAANSVLIGANTGNNSASGASQLSSGVGNTWVGDQASGSATDCANSIALGRNAVATKATGTSSGTFGPGFSLGSAAYPVGFRGDGTIIPSTSGGAGFFKAKINGTQYYVPLYADASASVFPGPIIINATASGTTQAAAINTRYICTNASQCDVTVPATASVGDKVIVVSQGAGGIKVTANTGQTIKGLGDTTTSAGSITCAAQYDAISVVCVVANTTWVVESFTSTLLTFA